MIDISQLNSGNRICAFIRHGEKNIEKFSLTDAGKREVVNFSQSLLELEKQIAVYTSPEDRCVETATIITSVVSNNKCNFVVSNILGKPGIQVKDTKEYTKLTDVMKCRDIFLEWKECPHDYTPLLHDSGKKKHRRNHMLYAMQIAVCVFSRNKSCKDTAYFFSCSALMKLYASRTVSNSLAFSSGMLTPSSSSMAYTSS